MHQTINFMAITAERQLLPAKAARGWTAAQARADATSVRSHFGRVTRILGGLRAAGSLLFSIDGKPGVQNQTVAKRLLDVLPTD